MQNNFSNLNNDRYSFFKFIFEIYFITERLPVFKENVKHLISTRGFTLSLLFLIFYKCAIYWIVFSSIWLIYVENNNGQGLEVLSVSLKALSPKTATNKFIFSKRNPITHGLLYPITELLLRFMKHCSLVVTDSPHTHLLQQ